MDAATKLKLQTAILDIISESRAHENTGNLDGEESVSCVMSALRMKGWRNIGGTGKMEELAEAAGFTVRQVYRGSQRRAYIGL